jgi:acetyltransferase-like isoleucine patch superfamily enzyme
MFYTKEELHAIGFKKFGENVHISNRCSIYNPQNITIGNNVRIDDFVVLSASTELIIGDYVHIACYSSIIGKGVVILEDFVGISGRVSIYSSSDDYTGLGMTNPLIPNEYKKVTYGDIIIKKHSIIGAGSVVLPNVTINEGASIGALSLVKKDCEEFSIYSGNPAIKIGKRLKRFLRYEEEFKRKNRNEK